MKKLLLLLSISFLLSSCIEIKETLTINNDGSGNIQLMVNMGKIGKSLGQQNQKIDMSFVTQIQNTPEDADSLLKSCKGISNLKTDSKKENGIYSVSFDFKNSKSLNEALYKLFRQKKSALTHNFINVSKHKIKQMNFAPLIKKYVLKNETNMISDMLYRLIDIETVFQLPSKTKSVSNIKAVNENDDKTVKLKYNLFELLNYDFDYGIVVKY